MFFLNTPKSIMKTILLLPLLALAMVHDGQAVQFNRNLSPKNPTYYLFVTNFANSFVAVQTGVPQEITNTSTTVDSSYLYGRAPLYNTNNQEIGVCAASFMNSKDTNNRVYSAISNFISTQDGMIVTWFTPTFLSNLELDSLVNGMVTECQVTCSTLVGKNSPYYGKKYTLIVSSSNGKIFFKFTQM